FRSNVIGIRRVGDGLAVAGTTDNDGSISGRGGHGPGQGAAVDIGGVQRQGEGGRRTVFGHADVDAVAFGNDRCVVDGIHRDGPRLGCRDGTVFTTVGYLHGDVCAADTVRWCPGDQASSGNVHAARRLRQRERQVGAVVGIVRIVYDELVAVLAAFRRRRRCNGGNGRRIVAVVDSNGPALRCGRSTIFATIAHLHGNINAANAGGRRPLHQAGGRNRHAGRLTIQCKSDIGAIVVVVRIDNNNLVTVWRGFCCAGRRRRGNGRRVVHRRYGNREGLCINQGTIAGLYGDIFLPRCRATLARQPVDHTTGWVNGHAGGRGDQGPLKRPAIHVAGLHAVLVWRTFGCRRHGRRGNHWRVVNASAIYIDGNAVACFTVAAAHDKAVAAAKVCIRCMADHRRIAGAGCRGSAVARRALQIP